MSHQLTILCREVVASYKMLKPDQSLLVLALRCLLHRWLAWRPELQPPSIPPGHTIQGYACFPATSLLQQCTQLCTYTVCIGCSFQRLFLQSWGIHCSWRHSPGVCVLSCDHPAAAIHTAQYTYCMYCMLMLKADLTFLHDHGLEVATYARQAVSTALHTHKHQAVPQILRVFCMPFRPPSMSNQLAAG